LCAIVTAPANTWSNLAYVAVGLYIMIQGAKQYTQKTKKPGTTLKVMGVAAIICGLTSLLYHASYTHFFQYFDFLGMYIYIAVPIALSARRMNMLQRNRQFFVALTAICVECVMTVVAELYHIHIQFIMAINIFVCLGLELALWCRQRKVGEDGVARVDFFYCILFLIVAFACSMMDLTGLWCDPKNHYVQGHALWHVFTSVSFFFVYRYFSQFDLEASEGLPLIALKQV
jgi:hypothetical protein